jgi:CPA2 family monovalent cation:H+ antiporter-2
MEETFLADLVLFLCVEAVTTVVFRKLRQPVVLGYLLAGLLVGPYTPVPLFASAETLHTLSELGVILLMFSIGLEFSLRKLAHVFPRAGLVAVIQIGAMLWLGYLAGRALGWSSEQSFFAGAIVSAVSPDCVTAMTRVRASSGGGLYRNSDPAVARAGRPVHAWIAAAPTSDA